jgi:TRAP-type mannitol/chloroaromatic compound transport system permease small subunit
MDMTARNSATLRVSAAIDRVTGAIGAAVAWLALVMVIVGAFNAVARYLGRYVGVNLSSTARRAATCSASVEAMIQH